MEADLVQRARLGDVGTFSALVREHTPGLYGFLFNRLGNSQLVADLTQETFLRAWRSIASFRGDCSLRSWLFRIALNLSITEISRQRRQVPWIEELDHDDPSVSPVEERLESDAERRDLQAAVAALPADDRELLKLLYQDRLSYPEISELMNMPLGTVKVRLYRVRKRLRQQLEAMWEVAR